MTEATRREPGDDGTAPHRLRSFRPFDRLSREQAAALGPMLETRHYRLGQTVLRADTLADGVILLSAGRLRSLANDPNTDELRTLEVLVEGDSAGWSGLLRQAPCEHLRAATDVTVLVLPATSFRELLDRHAGLREWYACHGSAAELHQLLQAVEQASAAPLPSLHGWEELRRQTLVRSLAPGHPGNGG